MKVSVHSSMLPAGGVVINKKGMIFLGLALLFISMDVLAGEEISKKPADWERQLETLRSVPYLAFSESVAAESDTGVVLHDTEKAWWGYNFYCTRSSGVAFLLDMKGQVVQRWTYPPKKGAGSDHALLLENGDLMVIKNHQSLLRLDWNSNRIWERRLKAHHDLALAADGTYYVIVRDYEAYRGMRVWFDVILHLTADGEELDRWHTFEHLAELRDALDTRSFLDTVLDSALGGRPEEGKQWTDVQEAVAHGRYNFDYFHLNTIGLLPATPLGEGDPRFRAGNLLVCFRNVNQIAVLERNTYRLLWAWGEGELQWPHHPTMLENGHILLFDNGVNREYSRLVELDPGSGAIVWEYLAEFPEDFYSQARGSAQRLLNGNTLITESDRGRVFEVTPEGEIVWMWLNPASRRGHRETVYRMIRLSKKAVEPLLSRWWWWEQWRISVEDWSLSPSPP